jgi:hypothetical protein
MKRGVALLLTVLLATGPAGAATQKAGAILPVAAKTAAKKAGNGFQFGVIGHAFKADTDEERLKRAIAAVNQEKPVFIVATGIKAASEPCSDKLYAQRKEVLGAAADCLPGRQRLERVPQFGGTLERGGTAEPHPRRVLRR